MSHFIIKLMSGENVFGVVDSTDNKMVILKNPLVWEEYENAEGHTGTALVKYINGSKETSIPISITSITSMAAMSKPFSKFYDAAVAVQEIYDAAYEEKLGTMTKRMNDLVSEYQLKVYAAELGGLVAISKDTDTIH